MKTSDGKCSDYEPGLTMGKKRKVCKLYAKNGSCRSPNQFMCVYWMEQEEEKEKKEAFLNMEW